MSRRLDILVLFDTAGSPPKDQRYTKEFKTEGWKAEAHVISALTDLGHRVRYVGIYDDLEPLLKEVKYHKPDLIFNLTEHFNNDPTYDRNVAGLLELLEIPYTGTKVQGLLLCKDKGLAKKILSFHQIQTPPFEIFQGLPLRPPQTVPYPMLIKPLHEEASYGISQNSLVNNDKAFLEQVHFIHTSMHQDVMAEQYIEGREIYVSILGNTHLQVLPFREIIFPKASKKGPRFATFRVKWNDKYRKRWGIQHRFANSLSPKLSKKIEEVCKEVYEKLCLQGYGRIDLRITPDNDIMVLEANPNPFIARDEDFALSAKKAGLSYPKLIQRIVNLSL